MSLFGGLTKGVERGIQLDGQFMSSFVWAFKNQAAHPTALTELVAIAEQNAKELIDSAGNVLPNVVSALLVGSDPCAGSRHAFEGWQAKYGHH